MCVIGRLYCPLTPTLLCVLQFNQPDLCTLSPSVCADESYSVLRPVHPFFLVCCILASQQHRAKVVVPARMAAIEKAIHAKDFETFGRITMQVCPLRDVPLSPETRGKQSTLHEACNSPAMCCICMHNRPSTAERIWCLS